jgi:hypothetical protein
MNNDILFDLVNEKFHIMLASGPVFSANSIGNHGSQASARGVSYFAIDLRIPQNVGTAELSSLLMLLHGSFMIVAWIGCSSIGVVFARYFKSSWKNRKIGGKDIWFFWHILCMFLTWVLTLAAFIIIFIDVGGWRTSVHAVTGCVVFVFACIQPIGAAFR